MDRQLSALSLLHDNSLSSNSMGQMWARSLEAIKHRKTDGVEASRIRRISGLMPCMEAFFQGAAFSSHRHDHYTLALTVSGVQCFNYRGALRASVPGSVVVLHPDEAHDGQAGTDEGFSYRSINLDPAIVQSVLACSALPFVEGGITRDLAVKTALGTLLTSLRSPLSSLEQSDANYDLCVALGKVGHAGVARKRVDDAAAWRAREYLLAHICEDVNLGDLASHVGVNRWSLSRDFRRTFGTSPHRFLTLRRLDAALKMLERGDSLTDVAAANGFSDQSHYTRHFRAAYGMTPGRYRALLASG